MMFTNRLTALLAGSMLVFGMVLSAIAADETVQTRSKKQDHEQNRVQQQTRTESGEQAGDQVRTRDQKQTRTESGDQTGDQLRTRDQKQTRTESGEQAGSMTRTRNMQKDRTMVHEPGTGGHMGSMGPGRGGR